MVLIKLSNKPRVGCVLASTGVTLILLCRDIVVSTHASPLESSLHSADNQPKLLIHGVYSKVPPCFNRSCTIRWSDPYLIKEWEGQATVERIEALMRSKSVGVAPYIPAVRTTLFLNAMIMLWLGAKRLMFTLLIHIIPNISLLKFENFQYCT